MYFHVEAPNHEGYGSGRMIAAVRQMPAAEAFQ
jgi:hypothetical protein